MSKASAEKAARQMMMSGQRHHLYEEERRAYALLFHSEREAFIQLLHTRQVEDLLEHYAELMGPSRLRAKKNALISMITSVCRLAIDEGVEAEFSFALSDYYINELEWISAEPALLTLMREILLHYYELVQSEKRRAYTKPIAAAVRYIGRNLYRACPVGEVAAYVGLNPRYFCGLFARQVGLTPSLYIMQRKLDEAKRMLIHQNLSVTEAAEALGFCDSAHFSRNFKKQFGIAPSILRRNDGRD